MRETMYPIVASVWTGKVGALTFPVHTTITAHEP